jgi:hypothetical protein
MAYPAPTQFFPFKPNWAEPVNEEFQFRSSVFRAGDGSEQTSSISGNHPRRALEFTALLDRNESQRVDSLLMAWSGRFFDVPHWAEGTKTQAAVGVGASTLLAENAHLSFAAGGRAVLYRDAHNYEVVTLADVTPGGLTPGMTLATPTEKAWGAGTRLFPVFPGLVNGTTTKQRVNDRTIRTSFRFEFDPANTPDNTLTSGPLIEAFDTYLGEELFRDVHNWRNGLATTSEADRKVLDKGTGKISVRSVSHFAPDVRQHEWLLANRTDAARFRGFLGRRLGRARPFYMPTGTDDMQLLEDPHGTSLLVKTEMYGQLLAGHPGRRDFIILMRDGTYHARRITSVEAITATTERVHFATMLPGGLGLAGVKRVSFLGYYRMQDDDARISWRTDTKATAALDFILKTTP